MDKMWAGFTDGKTAKQADEFNSSIRFDRRMVYQDLAGSRAHVRMLSECGIVTASEADAIEKGLEAIERDLRSGGLQIDGTAEDIHMFIEKVLTDRIGDVGKKLHTARSRNDQVALDFRLFLREECKAVKALIRALIVTIAGQAEKYRETVLPGYTHLQRAQPTVFGHHLLTYAWMLLRDDSRISDCEKRMNVSPIGSCALSGTTYPTDRRIESDLLGFSEPCPNSMDGVSDRDFALELLSCLSIVMMHLSRLSEELILWSSLEFCFIRLSDAYTTGSSIMPQKKNPDMAELVRGKTGRVYGDLMGLLTVMKGLPLAYNKDMQEDKEGVFDALDTVKACLSLTDGMISTMEVFPDRMRKAASEGFINATDLADYLVGKGLPFRDAYKTVGNIVRDCMEKGTTLSELPLGEYRRYDGRIGEDVYGAIDLGSCVSRRNGIGGISKEAVETELRTLRERIAE